MELIAMRCTACQRALRHNHEQVRRVLLTVGERLQPLAQVFPKFQIARSWQNVPWGLSLYTRSISFFLGIYLFSWNVFYWQCQTQDFGLGESLAWFTAAMLIKAQTGLCLRKWFPDCTLSHLWHPMLNSKTWFTVARHLIKRARMVQRALSMIYFPFISFD